MQKRSSLSVMLILVALVATGVSQFSVVKACLHGPRWYTSGGGKTSESRQTAIVFHSGGREELILKVDARLKAAEKMPATLGWVIPLPSVPDAYHVGVENELFAETRKLYDRKAEISSTIFPPYDHFRYAWRGGGSRHFSYGGGRRAPSIAIEVFRVGPYEIHQIAVRGANAVKELNEWFTANGFDEKAPAQMSFFVERQYTFLCIKVRPEGEKESFGETVAMPPLRISFASELPYYPLKFSSHQGVFDVDVTVFSDQPIDYAASRVACTQLGITDDPLRFVDLQDLGHAPWSYHHHHYHFRYPIQPIGKRDLTDRLKKPYRIGTYPYYGRRTRTTVYRRNVTVAPTDFQSESLDTLIDTLRTEARIETGRTWFVNRVIARSVNSESNPIGMWKEDIQFEVMPVSALPVEANKPARRP